MTTAETENSLLQLQKLVNKAILNEKTNTKLKSDLANSFNKFLSEIIELMSPITISQLVVKEYRKRTMK